MSTLIALVATAVVVDGERKIIQPGQPLPELSPHDARELLHSGAAQDPGTVAKAEEKTRRAQTQANADFAAARKAVRQAKDSTSAADTATAQGKALAPE